MISGEAMGPITSLTVAIRSFFSCGGGGYSVPCKRSPTQEPTQTSMHLSQALVIRRLRHAHPFPKLEETLRAEVGTSVNGQERSCHCHGYRHEERRRGSARFQALSSMHLCMAISSDTSNAPP